MPWKEFKIMDQREQFVLDCLTGEYPKGALCEAYGISRPTGTNGWRGITRTGWRASRIWPGGPTRSRTGRRRRGWRRLWR